MKSLHYSFAGGEITPEMYGRLDTTKYQTGLAQCRNFTTLPHGPATRRPGFRYVAEAKDSTQPVRLIPFQFSVDQTAVIEFSNQAVRFHLNGQQLLETSKAVVSIVGSTVTVMAHGWVTGDDVFIGTRFHRITVTGANAFTTADRWGAATVAVGATAARVYTVASAYLADDLFKIHYAQDSDVLTLAHDSYPARELSRLGATNWQFNSITFAPSGTVPTGVTVVATKPTPTNVTTQRYVVTSIGADGLTESLQSTSGSDTNNLSIAGNFNTISWSAAAGATRYNVYKQRGGLYGYIGSTSTLNLVDDNIIADTTKGPPQDIYTLNGSAGNYPSAVTYYEQRRWFAGTLNAPQTVWATRNGTESNLTSSTPSQDDDGLQFTIKSRQQNAIRHLLPLSDLLALTVGAEFRIFADNAPNITPTSLSTKPQGYNGASDVQPALAAGSVLYVQSQGSRIREMSYNWQANAFASTDVSIMAPHLFNNFSVVDMAYCRAPVPSLWVVRSDGVLLGLTYVPEQQVYAWHQHDTEGFFESCCVVSEGLEDVLYVVVRRAINNRSVRYIERLETRLFADQLSAFFVDCGATYYGAATTTISGLHHLEGETVTILADGAVHPDRVVMGGVVALDFEASQANIGLRYVSDLKTLPMVVTGAPAIGQTTMKNVNGVAIRVFASSTVKAGPTIDDLVEYPTREVSDPYGVPPALRTGELRFDIPPDWNSDGSVVIRQEDPLPLTVLSIALDVAVGG